MTRYTQDTCPHARAAYWDRPVRRLLATMHGAVPFVALRSSATTIVGEALAVDLICAADLRADIIRMGDSYVRSTPRQRERRLAELEQSTPQDVGLDRILTWEDSLSVDWFGGGDS